ncbi:hypothetical protein FHG87_007937 [Trinorchestia longiramus]|nr:hypothetical protein FHG87_007937 [Trinorchestia longiramus]
MSPSEKLRSISTLLGIGESLCSKCNDSLVPLFNETDENSPELTKRSFAVENEEHQENAPVRPLPATSQSDSITSQFRPMLFKISIENTNVKAIKMRQKFKQQKLFTENYEKMSRDEKQREKRSTFPCLPPDVNLFSSGETVAINEHETRVYVFPGSLPFTIRVYVINICNEGYFSKLEASVSSDDINITSPNHWHEFQVNIRLSSLFHSCSPIKITNLNSYKANEKPERRAHPSLSRSNVSITGEGVRWYEGRKMHNCYLWPNTTSPKDPMIKETSEGANSTSQRSCHPAKIHENLLYSLLALLTGTIVVLVVVIIQMKRKSNAETSLNNQHSAAAACNSPEHILNPEQRNNCPVYVDVAVANDSYTAKTSAPGRANPEAEYINLTQNLKGDHAKESRVYYDDQGNPEWITSDA